MKKKVDDRVEIGKGKKQEGLRKRKKEWYLGYSIFNIIGLYTYRKYKNRSLIHYNTYHSIFQCIFGTF